MKLTICAACSKEVASSARDCPHCGAVLQSKGFNLVGLVGLVLCLASVPSCVLLGPLTIGPLVVGVLLALLGRSFSPRWFAVRRATKDDAKRLGLNSASLAMLTPAQARFIGMTTATAVVLASWFVLQRARSSIVEASRPTLLATTSPPSDAQRATTRKPSGRVYTVAEILGHGADDDDYQRITVTGFPKERECGGGTYQLVGKLSDKTGLCVRDARGFPSKAEGPNVRRTGWLFWDSDAGSARLVVRYDL